MMDEGEAGLALRLLIGHHGGRLDQRRLRGHDDGESSTWMHVHGICGCAKLHKSDASRMQGASLMHSFPRTMCSAPMPTPFSI